MIPLMKPLQHAELPDVETLSDNSDDYDDNELDEWWLERSSEKVYGRIMVAPFLDSVTNLVL